MVEKAGYTGVGLVGRPVNHFGLLDLAIAVLYGHFHHSQDAAVLAKGYFLTQLNGRVRFLVDGEGYRY